MALLIEPDRRPCRGGAGAVGPWTLVFALLLAPLPDAHAQPRVTPTEQEVKAVFLFHFTRFVSWPASVLSDPERPFAICIFGQDPFGDTLDSVVAGERVNGKPISIVRDIAVQQASSCQLLYISEVRETAVRALLARLAEAPILTVSDSDHFLEHGGMVRFVTRRNRVQLEINPDAAARARLRLSSRLLSLARIERGASR